MFVREQQAVEKAVSDLHAAEKASRESSDAQQALASQIAAKKREIAAETEKKEKVLFGTPLVLRLLLRADMVTCVCCLCVCVANVQSVQGERGRRQCPGQGRGQGERGLVTYVGICSG